MATSALEQLQQALDSTQSMRTRIVWVVGRPGTGKTALLKKLVQSRPECEYLNVNRALAESLAARPPASRPFEAAACLSAALPPRARGAWVADNTELTLSRALQLSAVDRFKAIGQAVPLVVAWCGEYHNDRLIYGTPGHPGFREFALGAAVVVDLNNLHQMDTN